MLWCILLGSWLSSPLATPSSLPSGDANKHPHLATAKQTQKRASKASSQPTSMQTKTKKDKTPTRHHPAKPKFGLKKRPLLQGILQGKHKPPADIATHIKKGKNQLRFSSFAKGSFFWTQFLGMLVALSIVILLIYLLLRWTAQRMGVTTQGNKLLRVCDRLSLEPKKGLWIIEASGQYLLIATHEQGVTLLERLDPTEIQAQQANQQDVGGFWGRLRQPPPPTRQQKTESSSETEILASTPDAIPTQFEVVSDGKSASNPSK